MQKKLVQWADWRGNAGWIILLALLWFLPSFLFWHLHVVKNVMLPKIPEMIWLLPGKCWELSPLLGCSLILVFVVLVLFVRKAAVLNRKWLGKPVYALIVLIAIVHALWGIALL